MSISNELLQKLRDRLDSLALADNADTSNRSYSDAIYDVRCCLDELEKEANLEKDIAKEGEGNTYEH